MTGLALTTSLGIGGAPAIGAVDGTVTAADDRPGKPDRASTDNKGHEGKRKQNKHKGTPVPCSADALITAITLANARGGAVLDLAKGCTYLLTATIDGAGLPAITTPITLNGGKHTTITRAAAEPFRILTVDTGGDLTLNKLKITGGQTVDPDRGGGISVDAGAAATISHSIITGNIAGNDGGAVDNSGTTRISHSTLMHNSARDDGGAIYNRGTVTVTKSQFLENTTGAFGGAIHQVSGAESLVIAESSIKGNTSGRLGGGISSLANTITRITDTDITDNTCSAFGGGGIAVSAAQLALGGVTLARNTASGTGGGGLAVLDGATATVEHSTIEKNTAGANGGGIYSEGGITTVRNTKIIDNQADLGGGIYNNADGAITLYATKVVKNTAITDGGGIFNQAGGTVELNTATGTTVVKNRPNNCVNVTGCPD